MSQTIYCGNKSIDNLCSIIQDISPQNILIVRGKESYNICGAKNILEPMLYSIGRQIYEFYDFEINPKESDIKKGISYISNLNIDSIIAVGGGSVIDMAKSIRFFFAYGRNDVPLIAIPTTAGTGSEVTRFAVFYKNKVKYSIEHEAIAPDIAIIDPYFTYNNPKYLTACTGFDALAHAIESYWNIYATAESDNYVITAIRLLWENLPKVVNSPCKESRDSVSEGAFWAGKAINITKTTGPHALSYGFTAYYNIPHGHAVALTFPSFFKYNVKLDKRNYRGDLPIDEYHKKIIALLSILGIDNAEAAEAVFQNYINILGLSIIPNFDKEIIVNNVNLERMKNNPRILSKEDIYAMIPPPPPDVEQDIAYLSYIRTGWEICGV
jgi:alcohol dehydrogenase class IV